MRMFLIKRKMLAILIVSIVTCSLLVLTGCVNKEELKENVIQNTSENIIVESDEVEEKVNEKYGFKSKTTDENITVNLEEDPRPESFKIAQAVEQNLIDNNYKIELIDIGGYGSALSIEYKIDDKTSASLTFSSKDTLRGIHVFSTDDETLLPFAKAVIETDLVGFSEEDRNTMLNATEYTKVGEWSGCIGDSESSTPGRKFTFMK